MNDDLSTVGQLIWGHILIPIGVFFNGLTTMLLWNWFLVPLSLPGIEFWHATGIAFFVGFLTNHNPKGLDENKSKIEQMITKTALVFLMPIYAIIIGAIIYALM